MNPTTPNPNDQPQVSGEPTPQAPIQTTPVAETAPVGAPAPAPQTPGVNKKALIIIGSIIAAALIAVIGVFVYIAMTSVSKQDYADAAKQYNTVSSANSSLIRSVAGLSRATTASDDDFDKSAKAAEEAIATLKTENKSLGDLKASKVGEGKEVYDAFDKKLEAYTSYADELLSTVKTLRPTLKTCDSVSDSKDNATRVTAVKACSEALNKVGDVPNPEFKTFIDTTKGEYATYATTFEKLAAITNPSSQAQEYRTLRTELLEIQGNLSKAAKTLSTSLDNKDKDLSVKESADALRNYLNEQQRK